MKFISILGALSAAFILLAAGAADARHSAAMHTATGVHFLNPQPLPPG